MPQGYPNIATTAVTDKLATIAPTVGNVPGYYVWLKDAYGNTYGPSGATDGSGNWTITGPVPQGTYTTHYQSPNAAGLPLAPTNDGVKPYLVSVASNPPSGPYGPSTGVTVAPEGINLQARGAVLDGSADTIPVWTAAFAALPTGGGRIYVPPGSARIDSQLAVPQKVTVDGAGWTTGSGPAGTAVTRILKNFNGDGITLGEASKLRNLGVDQNGGSGAFTGDGVYLINGRVVVSEVYITNQGGNGLRAGGKTAGLNTNLFYLERVDCRSNAGHGFYIHDVSTGGGTPNANGFGHNLSAILNGGDGMRLEHELSLWLDGFYGASNTGYGMRLFNGAQGAAIGNVLQSVWNEGNGSGPGLIDNGCTNNRVLVNLATQAGDAWIDNNTDGSNEILGRLTSSGRPTFSPFIVNAPAAFTGSMLELWASGALILQFLQNGNIQLNPAATSDISINAGSSSSRILFGNNSSALWRMDFWGHFNAMFSGTPPVLTALGTNVTSGTPAGNDMGGTLTIVVSGAVAPGAVIGTFSFKNLWPVSPHAVQFTPASGSNPTFGNIGYDSLGGTSFIVRNGPVAMSAGTYVFGYQATP